MRKWKIFSVLALCLASVLLFAACTNFGKIEKAFKDEGWTVTKMMSTEVAEYGSVTVYSVQKGLKMGVIFEGKAGSEFKDIYTKIKEDEQTTAALKLLLQTLNDTAVVNGNCAIFTVDSDAITIFNSVE